MSKSRSIHSRHFYKQAIWFKAINGIWKLSYPLGTKSKLDKDSLIRAAMKATGLHDLGSHFWDEPLERMLQSINEEANLHPIGQFITRQRIINLLSVRLRAEYYFKKYPEILEQELYPVMLIIGLQRTGTTKLHRLLAADPDNRSILSWEALNPAPIKGDINTGEERIKVANTSVRALKFMSPGFFAIHPIEAEAPEEDVLLLDVSFLSTTAEATMHVPSYASWLEQADQSSAYEYMGRLLKLLQWQRPAKRWVLKTPHHLEFLDLVNNYFKHVQFIWAHRNVYESIPSFLSMVSYSRILFSSSVNPHEVATHWVRKNGFMLSKAMEFYKENNHIASFTDVHYRELLKSPMGIMEKIYSDRGEVISPELLRIFEKANRRNPKGKYGIHEYNQADFGIDEAYIKRFTSDYREFLKSKLK